MPFSPSLTRASLSVGLLGSLMLTSCSLPPEQAWRQIRSEGLIPYVMNGSSTRQSPTEPSSSSMMANTTPKTSPVVPTTPSPTLASTSAPQRTAPAPASKPAPSMPTAAAVDTLPGYVRSPFTNPPRLVDVRGMTPGSKVVCPYTQRPFLVPNAPAPAKTQIAINTTPAPTQPQVKPQPAPSAPQSPPTAPSAPTTAPAPQPKMDIASDLPFGNSIAGRPGFVNSPYAAKHQLVDVTGLPVGMEVKCPYTGKLFRVPPQAQAKAE